MAASPGGFFFEAHPQMSGGKGGSGPTSYGTGTSTVTNPTAAAQLPKLQTGWDAASNTFGVNPRPDSIAQGYDKVYNAAQNADPLSNAATGYNTDALGGSLGIKNSPSYGTLSNLSNTDTLGQYALSRTGDQLANSAYSTNPNYASATGTLGSLAGGITDPNYATGGNSLTKTANGDYLNSNPYVDKMYDSAASGITRGYQTATAPQTDSTFETAGRYGSGALGSARSQNELDLGKTLSNAAADIYGKNYANERTLQNTAGYNLGNLGLGAQTARTTAANNLGTLGQAQQRLQGSLLDSAGTQYNNLVTGQGNAATNLQTGYNTANSNTNTALGYYPGTQKQTFYPGQQMTTSGLGLQNEPYTGITDYLNTIGAPMTGSSSTTSPIYGPNALTSGIGTAGSLNSLLFGANSGGLLGSGGGKGAADAAALGGDFGGGGAAMGVADSILPAALEAAPAAAATIICTELMRQGRMPRRWWRASSRDWMPEIAHRGYLVWARPSVRHLQRHPYSLYSRLLCAIFNWRGEDAAARHGLDKNARRLWRGRAVTAALAIPCLALGVTAAIGEQRAPALRRA